MRARLLAALALAWPGFVAVLGGCNRAPPPAPPPPPQVTVALVRRAAVPIVIELPGRTSPYRVAQVRARVDGIVLKRQFIEGSDVKIGQRLYQIDPAPYRAALNNARASVLKAQANLMAQRAQAERYHALIAAQAVSKQDYDNSVSGQGQAVADVASARAMVETAQINLGYTDVTAPITGRVGISAVTEGAYVQASAATLMATIQQIDPIYVDLTQSSVQALALRRDVASGKVRLSGPGQPKVDVLLEDGSVYPIAGQLQFTDITVDQGTGSVTVRAIVENPRHVLLPGMFVRARLTEAVNEDALLVPQIGVTRNPSGQATVLVVGPDKKVQLRTVQVSRTYGTDWVVTGGLAEGEAVIVAGMQKAKPGATVQVTDTMANPAPHTDDGR
ncbi:efflux RND transporter periplasmic adaptor subunit [Massilia horti]|uniref:Efflux RND transporter periplasmic adaptor subunit n=1 Tax=Massilia horti TaxID=2562153 RepID=A0A4Y9SY68_9BURK|nr:efflux RND transporter periplasmic adaptor subunit [Massilia horti]